MIKLGYFLESPQSANKNLQTVWNDLPSPLLTMKDYEVNKIINILTDNSLSNEGLDHHSFGFIDGEANGKKFHYINIQKFLEINTGNKYESIDIMLKKQREFVNMLLQNNSNTKGLESLKKILTDYALILPRNYEDLDFDGKLLEDKYVGSFVSLRGYVDTMIDQEKMKYSSDTHGAENYDLDIDYDLVPGQFRLSEETMKQIEEMERKQGFNFDTTALKRLIGLNYLAPYQLKLLIEFGKYDELYETANRRAGKTWLFVYLAIRQLFLKNQTIIFLVPSEKFFKQPMVYFNRFLSGMRNDKTIRFSTSDQAIFNDTTGSVIWFVGAMAKQGVRSQEATLAIIDEASFVPDNEALSIETMLSQVKSMRDMGFKDANLPVGKLICGSTINPDLPKNWFYNAVRDIEGGINTKGFSIRVNVFQCPFYSDEHRDNLIKKFKNNPDRLKCELLAQFPAGVERFNIESATVNSVEDFTEVIFNNSTLRHGKLNTMSEYYGVKPVAIIGYDPAKKFSNCGINITELYYNRDTNKLLCFTVGEVDTPKQTPFTTQVQNIIDIKEYLLQHYKTVHIGIDNTGIGEPVSEMLKEKKTDHFRIQYCTGGTYDIEKQRNYFNSNGIYYIKKDYLMDIAPSLATMDRFKIYNLPRTYSDFELYNDINSYENSKGETIDFYHSTSISLFVAQLIFPNLLSDKSSMKGSEFNNIVKGSLSELIAKVTGQTNGGGFMSNKQRQGSDRFSKFLY